MKGFDRRLKSILLKRKVITEDKIAELESSQGTNEHSLAELLVEKDYLSEELLLSTIACEMNIPPVNLDRVSVEEDAVKTISEELASYYCVLPISKISNILTIAVSNPFDILRLDEIRMVTDCELRPVLSTEKKIRNYIKTAFNPGEAKIKEILESSEDTTVEHVKDRVDEAIDIKEITDDSSGSPVIKIVNALITQALREGASDIHIEPYEKTMRIRYRIDGILKEVNAPPKKLHNAIVSRVKIMSELDIAEKRIPQDGKFQIRYEGRQIDFRVSILPSIHGEKTVLRILDSKSLAMSLDKLGFEVEALDLFRKAISAAYGMILVTGPTGSGKSTTLYSALKEIMTPDENFVTVEDPIEYQLEGIVQVPVNVKKGLTFASALRSILRQDPDTIMIGEIRDMETADIAVKAAITGHLVLSTLHTNDAASAITRLIDMGIDSFMVASSVILVSAQRLLRKLCDSCKDQIDVPKDRLLQIGFEEKDFEKPFTIFKPVGCPHCTFGYKGRFAILEAMDVDEYMRKMIVEGKSSLEIKAYAITKKNMLTLRKCALRNVARGKTSIEETLSITMADF